MKLRNIITNTLLASSLLLNSCQINNPGESASEPIKIHEGETYHLTSSYGNLSGSISSVNSSIKLLDAYTSRHGIPLVDLVINGDTLKLLEKNHIIPIADHTNINPTGELSWLPELENRNRNRLYGPCP